MEKSGFASHVPCNNAHKSKMAIKEICKRFENLSESDSSKISECKIHKKSQQVEIIVSKTISDAKECDDKYNVMKYACSSNYVKEKTKHNNTLNSEKKRPVNEIKNSCFNAVKCGDSSDFPRVPTRRNKCKPCSSNSKVTGTLTGKKCVGEFPFDSNRKVSVRERTKLFENDHISDVPLKCSRVVSHNLPIHRKPLSSKLRNPTCQKNAGTSNSNDIQVLTQSIFNKGVCCKFINENPETPPDKPPRSFVEQGYHDNSLCVKSSDRLSHNDLSGKLSGTEVKKNRSVSLIDCIKSDLSKKNGPTSLPLVLDDEKPKSPRLISAPLRIIDDMKETVVKKSPKTPLKTHSIVNYFKQLGNTANSFCDKVKQKQSIFVDLTPTTVTPPKHYDTLKKSHSDEHIYAEPIFPGNSPEKQDTTSDEGRKNRQFPKNYSERNGNENTCPLQFGEKHEIPSVRNMIYESFSALRNSEQLKDSDIIDDTESDVSAQDIQERIIYVRSVRKQVSSSNICVSPKLFEAVVIVDVLEDKPNLIFQFPHKPKQGFDYPLLPHICFPDIHLLKPATTYKSETFHFTLVDDDEEKMFGYCHRILGWPKGTQKMSFIIPCAICILSTVSAPSFFKKLLNEIEKHLVLPLEQCTAYITSLQKLGIPNAGASLCITDNTGIDKNDKVVITRPLDFHTVSINLTRILQLLDIGILLKAVASLLLERRVLLLSKYSSNLSQCCEAIPSLLYPFHWQHLIIPILPKCLLVQTFTDRPYLLGAIKTEDNKVLDLLSEHQILIIDIDKGCVIKSYEDEDSILPKKIQKAVVLALNLAKNMTDPTEMLRDVMISEAFVHMFVEIFGHYEEFLITQNGSLIMQKEAFQKRPLSRSIHSFLQWFSETQMFDAFVDDCIWRKNYRDLCQCQLLTHFEKRVEEYKWELACENEKLSKIIGKTVKTFSEKLKMLKSF